jgi:hypothetical protein
LTKLVLKANRAGFVHGSAVKEAAQYGLPLNEGVQIASTNLRSPGHLDPERRSHILYQVGERTAIKSDHQRVTAASRRAEPTILHSKSDGLAFNVKGEGSESESRRAAPGFACILVEETRQLRFEEVTRIELNAVTIEAGSEING